MSDLAPEQIDYVNAHATSTPLGDVTEIRSIQRVFGAHAKQLKVNATKSMLGHTCWAAPVVETIAAVLQMNAGKLHPSINIDELDPEVAASEIDICRESRRGASDALRDEEFVRLRRDQLRLDPEALGCAVMNYFITGGSRGLGAAIVLQAVREGHDVAFTYRNHEADAHAVCEQAKAISKDRKVKPYPLDVSRLGRRRSDRKLRARRLRQRRRRRRERRRQRQ